jgi:hypothetical protein
MAIGPTEQRVDDGRKNASVNADYRRQPGDQGIRHALRDHHHRHHQSGADIAWELVTPVKLQPLQHFQSTNTKCRQFTLNTKSKLANAKIS